MEKESFWYGNDLYCTEEYAKEHGLTDCLQEEDWTQTDKWKNLF